MHKVANKQTNRQTDKQRNIDENVTSLAEVNINCRIYGPRVILRSINAFNN